MTCLRSRRRCCSVVRYETDCLESTDSAAAASSASGTLRATWGLLLALAPTSADAKDSLVLGIWILAQGAATWYWDIQADGTYRTWSTGPGGFAPYGGTIMANEGKWASSSAQWVDGGTYQVPNPSTWVVNGRLGTGYWKRKP